jgi:hypothetical protein
MADFIKQQKLFFVSTAPSGAGEVNLSPKGYDTLRLLDANRIVYLDYYGSGDETARHLGDNGRITLMWCSFDKEARILRAYGIGRVIAKGTPEFAALLAQHFADADEPIVRQLFDIRIDSLKTSCGFGVPYMECKGERPTLIKVLKLQIMSPLGKAIGKGIQLFGHSQG